MKIKTLLQLDKLALQELFGRQAYPIYICYFLFTLFICNSLYAKWPPQKIPDGLGVNIHFIEPHPSDMPALQDLGIRWLRTDLYWHLTEKVPGQYDFSPYDKLVEAAEQHGMKMHFGLQYGNPLYDEGLAPYSPKGREAYVRWAMAAMQHFQGRGIHWEPWNEPNKDKFWKPKFNLKNYLALMTALGEAKLKNFPQEKLMGPASAHIPLKFLEQCFQGGLLKYWDAVTVHPYRGWLTPETAPAAYRQLRDMIEHYAPEGKTIPIFSGEWGYADTQWTLSKEKQGKYLARMWLTNLSSGVPYSIWYDWRDDGSDPHENEHHYGMIENIYSSVVKKPAYLAAQTLIGQLKGFEFNKRIFLKDAKIYLLEFKNGDEKTWVVWTASVRKRAAKLPLGPGNFEFSNHLGEKLNARKTKGKYLAITVSNGPVYINRILKDDNLLFQK